MFAILSETFGYFSRRKEHGLKTVYLALTLLSLHWSLVIYVNSSYLGQFLSDAEISLLFTVGSIISIIPFISMSFLLRRFGNYRLTVFFILFEITALLGMASSTSIHFAIFFFLIHFITVPLIFLNLDVFMEKIIGAQEKQTGSVRGLYLTVLSLAGAVAPLITGLLLSSETLSFAPAYKASAMMLILFLAVITLYFKDFEDASYSILNIRNLLRTFASDRATRNIFFVQIFLQFFFLWTIIYIPLYLSKVAGFSWEEIGYILFVGLMAYVIFEYPVGYIADNYIGEKEMMALGFFIIAISISWFAFLPAGAMGLWMLATFITRTGASLVEASSESYFFKHVQSEDTDKISLFRMTRPISSVLGTMIGSVALLYMDFNLLFILGGFLMVPGIFFTLLLKDTK